MFSSITEPSDTYQKFARKAEHLILLRSQKDLETEKGFLATDSLTSGNHFAGDPYRYYFRYKYASNEHFSANFTAEKDAGEEFFKGSNKRGADFYSANMQFSDYKFIKKLILGDYRLAFGQGLALSSGFSLGKSSLATNIMATPKGISPYQSNDENRFFRGIAATAQFCPIDLSVWYSANKIDGNVVVADSLTGVAYEVSSLQTSGLHTTLSEIADEDVVRFESAGTNLSFSRPNAKFGLTFVAYRFSALINPALRPYNEYYFRGKSNYNVSADYRFRTGNLIFFGEEAFSENQSAAFLNGIESFINSRFRISLLSRWYDRNYQAFFANAFGENAINNNESGIYAGVAFSPFKYTDITAYIDVFRFPWLRYGTDMPSTGRDFLIQTAIAPNADWKVTLQYKNKKKEENVSETSSNFNDIRTTVTEKFRTQIDFNITERIELNSHIELSHFNNTLNSYNGYYVGSGLAFGILTWPLKLHFNYALFDTDGFNARIYAYENDLLYTFNIPMLQGQGSRAFAMLQYSLIKRISFWLKYGITRYVDQTSVGSGLFEVKGDTKSEVKAQLVIKF